MTATDVTFVVSVSELAWWRAAVGAALAGGMEGVDSLIRSYSPGLALAGDGSIQVGETRVRVCVCACVF